MIPWKGSFNNVISRDLFILYLWLQNQLAFWFYDYMLESVADPHNSASFLYSLLITHIVYFYKIDLLGIQIVKVFATYDSKTIASMGYALVGSEWCQKDFLKAVSDLLE